MKKIGIFLSFLLIVSSALAETAQHLVINEVMYDPQDEDIHAEWIELYNPTSKTIDISDWLIIFSNYKTISFEDNTSIGPNSFYLIADKESNEVQADYIIGFNLWNNNFGISLGYFTYSNPNGGVPYFVAVDTVGWGEGALFFENSPAVDVSEGYSLARISDGRDTDNNQQDFWIGNPTPKASNSIVPEPAGCLLFLLGIPLIFGIKDKK